MAEADPDKANYSKRREAGEEGGVGKEPRSEVRGPRRSDSPHPKGAADFPLEQAGPCAQKVNWVDGRPKRQGLMKTERKTPTRGCEWPRQDSGCVDYHILQGAGNVM